MRSELFLDTSALLYATMPQDPRFAAAVTPMASGGVTSVQVLVEFTTVARIVLRRSWPEIHEALSIFRILCPTPSSLCLDAYEAALEIVQQEDITLQDALAAATALDEGCTRILSDMADDGRVLVERLTVCNPFSCAGPASTGGPLNRHLRLRRT